MSTIFGATGAGLKFHGFAGLSRGSLELRERTSGRVTGLFLPGGRVASLELREPTSGRVAGPFPEAGLP